MIVMIMVFMWSLIVAILVEDALASGMLYSATAQQKYPLLHSAYMLMWS